MEWFKNGFIPKEIVTDNGSEFNNQKIKDMFRTYGIEHLKVSVESHRSNGRVERSIGTMREYIAKSNTNDLQNNIERYVNAYNNTYHTNIKMTLNEALSDYTNLDLQKNNETNRKMKAFKNKSKSISVGNYVRVCRKENTDKDKKGRFLEIGKVMHVFANNSVLVKLNHSGRIVKKHECDIKLCKLSACEGDVTQKNGN
ncbi:hypothetical protein GVAV_002824 [Gurleya vavrai]